MQSTIIIYKEHAVYSSLQSGVVEINRKAQI